MRCNTKSRQTSFTTIDRIIASIIAISFVAFPLVAGAQQARISPTHKDVAYDNDDPAQKLDVYLAKAESATPAIIYIHGGGWRAGSKNRIPGWLTAIVKSGSMSVISVEYRFTDVAPHPAQVNDCMRAVQFVRHNAKQWNIDPNRLATTGGSAGGHLSLWVALHDDIAMSNSEDPVERLSSRVLGAVSFAGPTDWSLLSELPHGHPAYRQLLGYDPGTPAEKMSAKKKSDVSPISFASKDDPPVLLVHGDADNIVPLRHAVDLDKQLKKVGAKSDLMIVEGAGHGVAGANADVSKRSSEFMRSVLLK